MAFRGSEGLLGELEKQKEKAQNNDRWTEGGFLKNRPPYTPLYTHTHTHTGSGSNPCMVSAAGSSGLHIPISAPPE